MNVNQQLNARDYFILSLMDLLKINTQNPMNIAAVEQITGSIPQKEFINFISFIAKSDNDYKKPIEIIATAVKDFEKIRIEQVKNSGLEDEIIKLINKCRYVSTVAYDSKPKGLNFSSFALNSSFLNFPNAFTRDEQNLLTTVGGCKRWLISHDDHSFFEDLLEAKIKSIVNYRTSESLTYDGGTTILKFQLKNKNENSND